MMKRRLLATAMTGMMALSTIMAMPMTTNAATSDTYEPTWYYLSSVDASWEDSGIPIVVTSSNDEYPGDVYGMYANMDELLATLPEGYFSDPEDEAYARSFAGNYLYNIYYSPFYYSVMTLDSAYLDDDDDDDYYPVNAGDSFTVALPFSGTYSGTVEFWDGDYWTVSFGNDSITFTCTEGTWYGFEVYALYKFLVENTSGQFWFEPMKNELAIAASIVEATGGTATAKASGDFALSYDIMKFLDDHPGVTLEYTMTYEGNEYLLVIPGGSQLANPEIPWYGPKYLIPLFAQN